MKKFLGLIFALLLSVTFAVAGCSSIKVSMPENYESVTSNGGFVVGVGDYLYFANAYQSHSSLSGGDNEGKVGKYATNRVKLLQNNALEKEEDVVNYETVINKITGFETSNIFVVGEYAYFTTPNVHKNDSKEDDKYNTYQFDLISLFRVKLDGTGRKEIYTTETSTATFELVKVDGKKALLVFDDNKIFMINAHSGATTMQEMADEVESTILPAQDEDVVNLYYTKAREEDDNNTGNLLCKVNLVTGEKETGLSGYQTNKETITLKAYQNGVLFYTRTGLSISALCSNDFSNGSASEKTHKYNTTVEELNYIKNADYNLEAFVYEYNGQILRQDMSADNDNPKNVLVEVGASLSFVDGTYVYYTTANGIYRVSVLTKQVQQIASATDFDAEQIDFDGEYVYYFAKAENSTSDVKYLHRALVGDQIETECIASIAEEDLKEDE